MGLLEKKIAPTLQRITGEDAESVSQDMTNKALYAALLAQVAVNADLYTRLLNVNQLQLQQTKLLQAFTFESFANASNNKR